MNYQSKFERGFEPETFCRTKALLITTTVSTQQIRPNQTIDDFRKNHYYWTKNIQNSSIIVPLNFFYTKPESLWSYMQNPTDLHPRKKTVPRRKNTHLRSIRTVKNKFLQSHCRKTRKHFPSSVKPALRTQKKARVQTRLFSRSVDQKKKVLSFSSWKSICPIRQKKKQIFGRLRREIDSN